MTFDAWGIVLTALLPTHTPSETVSSQTCLLFLPYQSLSTFSLAQARFIYLFKILITFYLFYVLD